MISFIVPAYNAGKTIEKCIESILCQDIDKEVIVIDNNSTDNTSKIMKKYPIKYFFESKKGPAAAKNRGLKETNEKSQYIAFVDSDVVLPKDWAKKALEIINKYSKKVAGVGGPGKSIKKNNISEVFDCLLYGRFYGQNLFVKSLATMDVMYRKDVINGLLFDDKLIAAEDPDFNLHLIKMNYSLLYSDELWVYHHNPTTINQVIKKWYNYGKYYPLPYFWNKQLTNFGLWGRILYLPLVLFCLVLSSFIRNFIPFSLIIFILPFIYFCLGIKLRIKNFYKLFVFITVHSLKQFAQVIGIWVGIISRIR
ncbi:MAG: glycosyltransferase [Bacteroidales bacterium]|nr:glycosyltransferase [Bacteroidales bacterium]